MKLPVGWRKEPARHALASKGVKTKNMLAQAQLGRIQRGGAVKNIVGRRTTYAATLRSLARKYEDQGDLRETVSEEDYERAIRPLFDTLADADELAERGDLKASVNMIDLARDQYQSMEFTFDVIAHDEARQWVDAVERITAKTVASSRQQMAVQKTAPPDQAHTTEGRQ
jgi:hypothetical protein